MGAISVISKNGSREVALSVGFVEELKIVGCFAPQEVKSIASKAIERKYFIQDGFFRMYDYLPKRKINILLLNFYL
ncbi:MAG: hypothetical protein CL530_03995 [Aequorivita sp.]|nr:hypothetical protein [Aequorivita sp.]